MTRWTVLALLLLTLATPALAGPVRCTTYPEPTLNRLQTLCNDGTRAVSRWNTVLDPLGDHRHAAAGADMARTFFTPLGIQDDSQ
jgi:hypothetical protein